MRDAASQAKMWRRPHRPSAVPRTPAAAAAAAALAALLLIFSFSILLLYRSKAAPGGDLALDPKRDIFAPSAPSTALRNGTDLIWQIPASARAALFIAHGCNGRAANFWDRSPACPHCVGLPEERLVVLHALSRGFAVLTVSSLGRCWTLSRELDLVGATLEWWAREFRLDRLPLVALGASSGGYFVSALAARVRFSSVALMISEGVFDETGVPDAYPPTLFVHMPKDRARSRMVRLNMEALRGKGVEAREIRCAEFPLTPDLLSARIPGLDRAASAHVFGILRHHGFVDGKGFMRRDGRATRWKEVLGRDRVDAACLELADHIQEELNLAYAYHEMTSLPMEDILSWFESHLNRSRVERSLLSYSQ